MEDVGHFVGGAMISFPLAFLLAVLSLIVITVRQKTQKGYVIATGPVGVEDEGETLQCEHCGMHWKVEPGSGRQRGYCLNCEEDIDPKRLEFDPSVPLCIECASKGEK